MSGHFHSPICAHSPTSNWSLRTLHLWSTDVCLPIHTHGHHSNTLFIYVHWCWYTVHKMVTDTFCYRGLKVSNHNKRWKYSQALNCLLSLSLSFFCWCVCEMLLCFILLFEFFEMLYLRATIVFSGLGTNCWSKRKIMQWHLSGCPTVPQWGLIKRTRHHLLCLQI